MSSEQWRPVRGYRGSYEVSDRGRVRSLPREVKDTIGRTMHFKGRILKASKDANAQPRVTLCDRSAMKFPLVAGLVAEAWLAPRPPRHWCRHVNGNIADNRAANLEWSNSSRKNN